MLTGAREPKRQLPPGMTPLSLARKTIENSAIKAAEVIEALLDSEDEKVRLFAAKEILAKTVPDKIEQPYGYLDNCDRSQLIGIINGDTSAIDKPSPVGVNTSGEGSTGTGKTGEVNDLEGLQALPGPDTVSPID